MSDGEEQVSGAAAAASQTAAAQTDAAQAGQSPAQMSASAPDEQASRAPQPIFAPAFSEPGGHLTITAPKVIVPLTGTTAQMLVEEAIAAEAGGADVLEWRVDFMFAAHEQLSFAPLGNEVLLPILQATHLPLLITIRTAGQGGEVRLSEGRYRLVLAELLDVLVQLSLPTQRILLDLEQWLDSAPALAARAQELGVTVIMSHHDWHETPDADVLQLMYEEMLEMPGVVVKLAVKANSDADVTRLLQVSEQVARESGRAVIAISMGDQGRRSRFAGWRHGSVATFARVGVGSAPGQPTVAELRASL